MSTTDESEDAPAPLIDLAAIRRQRLEDEQLRVLATAVGDHVLPPEQLSRLEHLREELSDIGVGPALA